MIQIMEALEFQLPEEGLNAAILNVMEHYNMHHVPSPEMEDLDLKCFYVAVDDGVIVGACGYKMLSQTQGKTTLLAVIPSHAGSGIGVNLQNARIEKMRSLGATKVITNADRPKTILWYKKQGYLEIGTLKKIHSFGLATVDAWTTLELSLK